MNIIPGRITPLHLVIFLYVFVTLTATRSVDFGVHWDEDNVIDAVSRSYHQDLFLQDWSAYPSGLYNLTVALSIPYLLKELAFAINEEGAVGPEETLTSKNAY